MKLLVHMFVSNGKGQIELQDDTIFKFLVKEMSFTWLLLKIGSKISSKAFPDFCNYLCQYTYIALLISYKSSFYVPAVHEYVFILC